MDLNMELKLPKLGKKSGKKGKMRRREMPVKRSINLAVVNEKPFNFRIAIPAIVLIILGAIALSKFAVVDRIMAMNQAQNEVSAMRAELNACYGSLQNDDSLAERYAHYTYSGMTQEELLRTDRVKVLQLLQEVVVPQAEVSTWSVGGNVLTLNLNRNNLQEINLLVQELNTHKLVEYCTVTTASGVHGAGGTDGNVNAQVIVYLKSNSDEEEAQEETQAEDDKVGNAIDSVTDTVVGGVAGNVVGDLQAGKEGLESNEDIR